MSLHHEENTAHQFIFTTLVEGTFELYKASRPVPEPKQTQRRMPNPPVELGKEVHCDRKLQEKESLEESEVRQSQPVKHGSYPGNWRECMKKTSQPGVGEGIHAK